MSAEEMKQIDEALQSYLKEFESLKDIIKRIGERSEELSSINLDKLSDLQLIKLDEELDEVNKALPIIENRIDKIKSLFMVILSEK